MTKTIPFLIFTLGLLTACKKTDLPISNNASVNIINATSDISNIAVSFATKPNSFYQDKSFIPQASSYEWGLPAGDNSISLISSQDTTKNIFSSVLTLKPNAIYSLYVFGQAQKIDTLLTQDIIPYYAFNDSSAGIRFINLLGNSQSISINISGNLPSQSEFNNLIYKGISDFKAYPVTNSIGGSYNFEIRDQKSSTIISNFSWYYTFQRNNTIVISGTDLTDINIFPINNF